MQAQCRPKGVSLRAEGKAVEGPKGRAHEGAFYDFVFFHFRVDVQMYPNVTGTHTRTYVRENTCAYKRKCVFCSQTYLQNLRNAVFSGKC